MPVDEAVRPMAVAMYRALEAAGEVGLSTAELAGVAWIPAEHVVEVIHWMRTHGVAVTHRIVGPNDARYILAEPLPTIWGEMVR